MPMSLRLCVAAVILLLLGGQSSARAEQRFDAAVDRTRASQSEPIRLTLTLTSAGRLNHVPSPSLDLTDFDVFGPSVSTRVEIINGRSSFARELSYTLYGRKTGRFRIGPATIEVDGETLSTKPVDVEIVRRGQSSQAQKAAGGEPAIEDMLFVRAVVERDTAYVGQQVVVRFDLCYRFNLRDVGFAEIPTFTGFWVKELFAAQRLAPKREVINGVAFNVAPLRRVALFPTHAGTHTVEPLVVSCSVPQGRSRGSLLDALSLFDDPVFGRGQTMMIRSEALPVHVLPLPEKGRPANFAGAVGRFSVTAEAQPRQLPVGDPVTLRVEVEGDGNVQSIPEPDVALRGFEVYAPTVELVEGQTPTGAYGARKQLEYILIPEQSGRRQIPAISVSYFDPEAAQYRTTSTAAFDIVVDAASAAGEVAPGFDLTRSEIEQLGRDIRHIKPDVVDLESPTRLYRSTGYWLLHGLLPLAYVGLVFLRRHQQRLLGDSAYARRRRARGEAVRRLSEARDRLAEGDGFHGALQDAIVAFVADLLNHPAPGLTRAVCRRLLQDEDVPARLVDDLDSLFERCEFGRFAPSGSTRSEREALLHEGEEAVERLREVLA